MDADEVLKITKQYREDFTSIPIDKLQLLTICLLEINQSLNDKVSKTPELQGLGYLENMEYILENMGKTVSKHLGYINGIIQYKAALGLYDSMDKEKVMYFDLKMIESLYYIGGDDE